MHGLVAGDNAIPGWERHEGDSPLIAVALHSGHLVPLELANLMAVTEEERLREEDPYTGEWTVAVPNRLVVRRSRFLCDLNQPHHKAIYMAPEDAWGLEVWEKTPPVELERELRAYHDAFYVEVKRWFDRIESQWGRFVVLDLHAYNHRRSGPDAPPAPAEENPDVNIGTGTMDRNLWGPLVDRFIRDLKAFDCLGRKLDVRENVRFTGGEFPNWVHRNYPTSGCVISVDIKKIFMDEWTGMLYPVAFDAYARALRAVVPGILEELEEMRP
ncbi:MAG: N-formylglutamate amidohydrolase [Magnetococcales bacterium]|nr:N-formylglutamate amidohydrolase [Magnetococcales bacterium]